MKAGSMYAIPLHLPINELSQVEVSRMKLDTQNEAHVASDRQQDSGPDIAVTEAS
jgi:hypothetical protein